MLLEFFNKQQKVQSQFSYKGSVCLPVLLKCIFLKKLGIFFLKMQSDIFFKISK